MISTKAKRTARAGFWGAGWRPRHKCRRDLNHASLRSAASCFMAIQVLLSADSLHTGSHPECLHQSKKDCASSPFCFGGDSWDRTNDLMHVKHAL